MYSVILGDGTTFKNLDVNGSYFVSKKEVTREMFEGWGGKYRVVLEDGEDELGLVGEYSNCEIRDLRKGAHAWYFALGEIDTHLVETLRDRADIDYIAMMAGIEL